MVEYVTQRWEQIVFAAWQHLSLVVQCLILATAIAVLVAIMVYRRPRWSGVTNAVTAIGLTIPSFAMIGILIAPLGFGVPPAVVVITFFAVLPILRNAVVGLTDIDANMVESAKGIGMSSLQTLFRVELPQAWPVILGGIRVAAQMVMGVAAVAAYVLGPGMGGYIFSGLSRLGGENSLESVVTGVIGIIILALLLDLFLLILGRLTISRGIRV